MSGTKTIQYILISVLTLISADHAFAQQRSFTLLRDGSACGTVDLTVERLQNGYVQYGLREERSIITAADHQERHLRTLTIMADTTLRIISLDGMERMGSREWKLRGSCANGILHLSREDASGRVVRWRSDCAAVPDIMLPELLRQGSPQLPETIFDTRDLEGRPAEIAISPLEHGGYAITVDEIHIYEVDNDGLLTAWRDSDHGLAWIPASGTIRTPSACDLDCGVFWDLGQVLLPTSEDNVRSMTVLLRLSEQTGVRRELYDPRQEVRDENLEDGSLTLRIRRERVRVEEASLPIRDAELQPYLQADPLLPLGSELLRERAAALRNWDRNAANVARSIARWCAEEFHFDAFIPVVPADRLVRAPRGTSLHASILFVALARKAGVPARFVLGLAPQEGRWRSTVWTEAWSGKWVPVDPIRGDILDDPLHVKLLHAADVESMRAQAGRLQSTLRIELRSVEQIDPSVGGELFTGIVHGTYTNRRFRCSIDAPEGWIIEERELGEEIVVSVIPEFGSEARFELHLFRNPYRLFTQELFETRERTIRGVLDGLAIEEKGELRFGERRAPYVVYSYDRGVDGAAMKRIRTADCIFSIGIHGYLLRFSAPADRFATFEEDLQHILRSMRVYD